MPQHDAGSGRRRGRSKMSPRLRWNGTSCRGLCKVAPSVGQDGLRGCQWERCSAALGGLKCRVDNALGCESFCACFEDVDEVLVVLAQIFVT